MGRFAHPGSRRFLCSCTPALGLAFLPKCPLCLAAVLAGLGITIPISRNLLTFLLLSAPACFLVGTVADPSGAAVSQARVAMVNDAQELTRSTLPNAAGVFEFPSLSPGVWTLTVEATGFKRYRATPVEVQLDQTTRVEVKLDLGE